jgi:hypothetical protein
METNVINTEEPVGLGGWLVVVGIGIIIAPFNLVATTFPIYLSLPEVLEAFPSFGGRFVLVLETSFNLIYFFACLYSIRLFFLRHYLFPIAFIVISIANLSFQIVDGLLASIVLEMGTFFDHFKIVFPTFISVLIWVPYMRRSKRVKNTFVEGKNA